jgi:hypothetical protein
LIVVKEVFKEESEEKRREKIREIMTRYEKERKAGG